MLSEQRVRSFLERFPGLTIGLVGDLFLDRYLIVDPNMSELSIETGLEAYQITQVRNSPGALGTVMNNLAALGVGRMIPVTAIGDDGQAYDLIQALQRLPVSTEHVIRDAGRMTPTYTKPMQRAADGTWRELNRLDFRNHTPPSPDLEQTILERISQLFERTDGIIVLDQVNEEGWGVVTPRVREHLARLAKDFPDRPLFIDSRRHIGRFTCGMLKPNREECLRAVGIVEGIEAHSEPTDERLRAGAAALSRQTGRPVFCTLGEQGMLVVREGKRFQHVPGYSVTGPIDIVGAGDSATAGIVASLLCGADVLEAAAMGNLAASITIQQLGTTGTASPGQVLARHAKTVRKA